MKETMYVELPKGAIFIHCDAEWNIRTRRTEYVIQYVLEEDIKFLTGEIAPNDNK